MSRLEPTEQLTSYNFLRTQVLSLASWMSRSVMTIVLSSCEYQQGKTTPCFPYVAAKSPHTTLHTLGYWGDLDITNEWPCLLCRYLCKSLIPNKFQEKFVKRGISLDLNHGPRTFVLIWEPSFKEPGFIFVLYIICTCSLYWLAGPCFGMFASWHPSRELIFTNAMLQLRKAKNVTLSLWMLFKERVSIKKEKYTWVTWAFNN